MPRQAHGRSLVPSGPSKQRKRKPAKGRGLHALETAEREYPDQVKIRQHRLGEAQDDSDTDDRSAKRRKVDATADDESSGDQGSDPDGNPWHVGVEDDDEDSDIDSDEAFGESDEERFADFTFRGSIKSNKTSESRSKKAPRNKSSNRSTIDESGDDDGDSEASEASSLGNDAVDLAAAWDMDDEEEKRTPKTTSTRKPRRRSSNVASSEASDASEYDDGSEDSGGDDNQDVYSDLDASNDEQNDVASTGLRNFVDSLLPVEQSRPESNTKRNMMNLPAKPSPFALPSARISAADLMQYVKDPTQRQSLKILQAAERETPANYKGGIPGKLAAPLAKRQQDRLDRVAAYDQTKQTLDRWVDTVKQNRRAEHVSFPQIDPAKASASAVKSFQPIFRTAPQSELESKIQEIMQESGFNTSHDNVVEDEEQKYEELKEKQIPLDEVQARRRELRMQRELMFREEVRAKRIKKIKSKAYRRIHRKEKDKFAAQERDRLAAAGVLNSDEEREHNDRRRAEERMGARHRESKWAKAAKATGQTTWNEDAKMGVSELARRDEDLRRRVKGKDVRGSDGSGSDSESDSVDGSDSNSENARWNERLDGLAEPSMSTGKSKLADMAFMQKAEAERKAQNDEELRGLRRILNGDEAGSDSQSDNEEVSGRQKYGKPHKKQVKTNAAPPDRNEFEEFLSEDEIVEQSETVQPSTEHASTSKLPTAIGHEKGTKFVMNGAETKASRSRLQIAEKSKSFPSNARPDNQVVKAQQLALDDFTSSSESEADQNDALDDKDKLALEIFAGDDEEDLRKQFEREKKQIVEEEGDQVIDNSLPGWGNWTGAGVSKREQKKAKGRLLTTIKGVAPEARRDAKLDRVIVNEKRIKKNSKYLATELPHPFESRQQYERSLRLPMGPEWSTRNHYQDAIKPRVLLKQGQVIKPMARPLA